MPKQVDHRERRESIARALWAIVDQRGWARATMREVAQAAGVSLGQLQHYFASRAEMLSFAVDFAADQTARRVTQELAALPEPTHPRDALRIAVTELLPLQPDARATSRLQSAYVLEALHEPTLKASVSRGLRDGRSLVEAIIRQAIEVGQIDRSRDAGIETDRILALSGLASLLELDVIDPAAALAAIDQHLDELFQPHQRRASPTQHVMPASAGPSAKQSR